MTEKQTHKKEDKKSDPELGAAGVGDSKLTLPSYFGPPTRFQKRNNPIDAQKYDYQSNRTFLTAPNDIIASMVHMLMYGLGGGLVVLHAAYMECGIFLAIGINLFLASIIGYCVCMLVWSAQKLYGRVEMPALSYPDIIEAAILLSPWNKLRKTARGARYLLEASLMIHLYGTCCVLIIMIARALKELVMGDHTISDAGEPPLKVYILTLMVPCLAIAMVVDLKTLAPFALICNLFAFAVIMVLLWYSLHSTVDSPWDRAPYKSVMGAFEFVGVCIFVLEPVSYALAVENNMQEPRNFNYVVLGSMPIYTACMVTVGFFGYWYYAENCVSPITIHFPYSDFAVILKVFLCITLYVIYAMCFHVAFDVEWFYLKRNHQIPNYWYWERLYRTLHVVVLIFISYMLPNVTRMMGVIGGFFTTPAVLIYPAIIELILDWEYPGLGKYQWRLVKSIFIVSVGLIALLGGTYFNVVGMIQEVQIQYRGDFKPIYSHHDNQDDNWKSYIYMRIDTEDRDLYNDSDINANFYDTMSKNTTTSNVFPYNKTYELPENINNSAVYAMPGLRNDINDIIIIRNKNNTIDGSTTALSNDVYYITPGVGNTSVIVYDKNTITAESTISLSTDIATLATKQPNAKNYTILTNVTAAIDDKIDKELLNVTATIAPVIKNDTRVIGAEIDRKLSNHTTRGKINKTFNDTDKAQ